MWSKLNFHINKVVLGKLLASFIVYVGLTIILRMIGTVSWDLGNHNHLMVYGALCFTFLCYFSDYCKKEIITYILFSVLFTSVAYIKTLVNIPLNGEEILDTFSLGILIFGIFWFLFKLPRSASFPIMRRVIDIIILICFSCVLLIPLLFWGYYFVSGQLLTGDIILTLFQTNFSEAKSYLENQNVLRWALTGAILAGTLFLSLYQSYLVTPARQLRNKFTVFLVLYLIFFAFFMVPKTMSAYVVSTGRHTYESLSSFKEYGQKKTLREQRLKQLNDVKISVEKGGVYVLVIGESETRDHMEEYGYKRDNTPWMKQFEANANTLIFKHPYACHTHTVAVLTYALSEKNQYNNMNLSDAYSIMEVAKAAGYKTYWISNQEKFGIWDTPVSEIASTADFQIWINGNVGKQTNTMYYDEELSKHMPDLSEVPNAFIVVHLMGSHQTYDDRYPAQYNRYMGQNKNVDTYDNSILYNDAVLKKLYLNVHDNPNFKAWVYMSDHGDDADANIGHEASKFTFTMARIPLIMNFSDSFIQTHTSTYDVLRSHTDSFWTNDLLYNFLIDIMDIEGVNRADNLDLASPSYDRNANNLLSLHGQKKISEDPNLNN